MYLYDMNVDFGTGHYSAKHLVVIFPVIRNINLSVIICLSVVIQKNPKAITPWDLSFSI